MSSIYKRDIGLFFAAVLVTAALFAHSNLIRPALGKTPELSDNLYAAVYAEEECGSGQFSQTEWQRLVGTIGERWGTDYEVGDMLLFVEKSGDQVRAIRHKRGCDADELQRLRALFDQELRPAL